VRELAAGEPGPYVLLAHSYGGLIAELYARTYPEEVAGRVNVDVTSTFLQDTLPPAEYQALIESTKTPPAPGGAVVEAVRNRSPAPPCEPTPREPVLDAHPLGHGSRRRETAVSLASRG
jgi:pimeloyl-ACP methyl ester carboxylesterase